MELPKANDIPPMPPLLYSTVLKNGGWDISLDIESRTITMCFYPMGMPFIRLLEFSLPSLAFVQFYQQCKTLMDRLSNEQESVEDELPPAA